MAKVLVVDDDLEMLTAVNFLLTNSGYKVKTEYKGGNTFRKIKAFKPDVVLLDIKLGNADGRNITNRIKSNVTTRHIPVILFSAINGIDKNLAECLNDDFIPKPFDVNELVNKIQFQIESVSVAKNTIDDQQLMRMFSYKPIEASGFFYDKYSAVLFGYILSITKNEKQSEIILIKTFLEIFQHYKEYDSKKQSPLVWCIGFANKQIIEIYKTERKLIIAEIFTSKLDD